MPNIMYKSCYYLFILLHEKFFVTPPVYFVTCIFSETLTKKSCFSFKYFSAVGKLDILGY